MADTESELTPEKIEALRALITSLGKGDCDTRVVSIAQRIAEPGRDEIQGIKGSEQNVYAALPTIADDARQGKNAKINVNGNDTVDIIEVTAAMIAAAQVAKRQNIKIEDVSIDDIAKLSCDIYKLLQNPKDLSCRAPKR